MSEPIHIELAGIPVGKGRPRFVRATGRAYTPDKTRRYESDLRLAAQDAMDGRPPLEGPVAVTIFAYMPIPESWSAKKREAAIQRLILPTTKPDADNLLKVCDALNEIVFRDDKQIVSALVWKEYSARPCLTITVGPVLAPDAETFSASNTVRDTDTIPDEREG